MKRLIRFVHINPAERTFTSVYGEKPPDVYVGRLRMGEVDHGQLAPNVGIIVWEHGLLEGDGPYFTWGGQLYAGDAIVYGFSKIGNTIDVPRDFGPVATLWFSNKEEVEFSIAYRQIARPFASVGGKVTWEWNR